MTRRFEAPLRSTLNLNCELREAAKAKAALKSTHYFEIIPSTSQTPHSSIMPATTAETLSLVTRNVSVAPLVLLSAADHYGRSAKGTRKRVVGVLLGQNDGKNVRVSNSFAGGFSLLPTQFAYFRALALMLRSK